MFETSFHQVICNSVNFKALKIQIFLAHLRHELLLNFQFNIKFYKSKMKITQDVGSPTTALADVQSVIDYRPTKKFSAVAKTCIDTILCQRK